MTAAQFVLQHTAPPTGMKTLEADGGQVPTYYLYHKSNSRDLHHRAQHENISRANGMNATSTPAAVSKKSLRAKAKAFPVKFDDREASVVELEPCDEDPSLLWFSKQEIVSHRKEGRALVQKVRNAGGDTTILDEAQGECFRGLEHGLSSASTTTSSNEAVMEDSPLGRSQRTKNIIHDVLAQQQEIRELGLKDDPKGLQVSCSSQTQWAKKRAAEQGKEDFETACQIWMEDEQCAKLLSTAAPPKPSGNHKNNNTVQYQILEGNNATPELYTKNDSPEERRATLEMVSQTVSAALAELDDMDDLDF